VACHNTFYNLLSDVAQKYIANQTVQKIIVVPGKLVNFVVS